MGAEGLVAGQVVDMKSERSEGEAPGLGFGVPCCSREPLPGSKVFFFFFFFFALQGGRGRQGDLEILQWLSWVGPGKSGDLREV